MKNIKILVITIFMVIGGVKASAQTMMNLEDIEYYLENFQVDHTVYYNQLLQGSYDSEMGVWYAEISRSTLPQLTETVPDENGDYESGEPLYGFLVFVYDHNDDHCYRYDFGKFFPYITSEYGSLEYDGTGILQYLSNEEDEEEVTYIQNAYFQCDLYDLIMSTGTTTIRLVIYE